jgi:hypothetical protein
MSSGTRRFAPPPDKRPDNFDQGVNMKKSAIRGVLIFAAGAATAALASGLYPKEPITAPEFQERATRLIADVEALGAYVALTEKGRVGLFTDPYACIPPVPPVPILPANAVDPRTLRLAVEALMTLNEGYMLGETEPVYEVGRCKPYAGSIATKR